MTRLKVRRLSFVKQKRDVSITPDVNSDESMKNYANNLVSTTNPQTKAPVISPLLMDRLKAE